MNLTVDKEVEDWFREHILTKTQKEIIEEALYLKGREVDYVAGLTSHQKNLDNQGHRQRREKIIDYVDSDPEFSDLLELYGHLREKGNMLGDFMRASLKEGSRIEVRRLGVDFETNQTQYMVLEHPYEASESDSF